VSEALTEALARQLQALRQPTVSRGRTVVTLGPWTNGHDEQVAIVTHVYGCGLPGDLVNLHVFVDLAETLIASEVPWYPTRADAEQALAANAEKANITGGAVCCYFPDRV